MNRRRFLTALAAAPVAAVVPAVEAVPVGWSVAGVPEGVALFTQYYSADAMPFFHGASTSYGFADGATALEHRRIGKIFIEKELSTYPADYFAETDDEIPESRAVPDHPARAAGGATLFPAPPADNLHGPFPTPATGPAGLFRNTAGALVPVSPAMGQEKPGIIPTDKAAE